jgi:hypothetical protein
VATNLPAVSPGAGQEAAGNDDRLHVRLAMELGGVQMSVAWGKDEDYATDERRWRLAGWQWDSIATLRRLWGMLWQRLR